MLHLLLLSLQHLETKCSFCINSFSLGVDPKHLLSVWKWLSAFSIPFIVTSTSGYAYLRSYIKITFRFTSNMYNPYNVYATVWKSHNLFTMEGGGTTVIVLRPFWWRRHRQFTMLNSIKTFCAAPISGPVVKLYQARPWRKHNVLWLIIEGGPWPPISAVR